MRVISLFLLLFISNVSSYAAISGIGLEQYGVMVPVTAADESDSMIEIGEQSPRELLCLDPKLLDESTAVLDAFNALRTNTPDAVFLQDGLQCIDQKAVDAALLNRFLESVNALAEKAKNSSSTSSGVPATEPPSEDEKEGSFWTALRGSAGKPWKNPNTRAKSIGVLAFLATVNYGVIMLMPKEWSHWDYSSGAVMWDQFKQAYTKPPVWDKDQWEVNFIGHPYSGMQTFMVARSTGRSFFKSFLFSSACSVAWEFALESWMERPSIQDLLFTSTIGSVLGELNYQLTKKLSQNGFTRFEKVVVTILNPIYVFNNGYH